MTKTEKEGVKAIIKLQAMAGITEPEDKALAGWRAMTKGQQEFTLGIAKG